MKQAAKGVPVRHIYSLVSPRMLKDHRSLCTPEAEVSFTNITNLSN